MQFPIRLAYSMTINKSQGRSLRFVGVNLVEEVFSHRQLYVGLSRAIYANQVKVLLLDTITGKHGVCQNIVFTEEIPLLSYCFLCVLFIMIFVFLFYFCVKFRVCEKVGGLGGTPRNTGSSYCFFFVLC